MRILQQRFLVGDGSATSGVNADEGVYWGSTVRLPDGARFLCVSFAEVRATWSGGTEIGVWTPFALDNYTKDEPAVYFRFFEAPLSVDGSVVVAGSFFVSYAID